MSYLMFIDESGHDLQKSPYEVLAGVVIEDRKLWKLVQQLHRAEVAYFGDKYSALERELKAKKLLKTKVFRHAAGAEPFDAKTRSELAKRCLTSGSDALPMHWAALAQAKIAFAEYALRLCKSFDVHVFASIVTKEAPRPSDDYLRNDYVYLFERFHLFLESRPSNELGLVVFDELERSQSHLLIDQMERYFVDTRVGRTRAQRIIPEPFFVHSHLTTGVQLADLAAYIISWGIRLKGMTAPVREELARLAACVDAMKLDQKRGVRTV